LVPKIQKMGEEEIIPFFYQDMNIHFFIIYINLLFTPLEIIFIISDL